MLAEAEDSEEFKLKLKPDSNNMSLLFVDWNLRQVVFQCRLQDRLPHFE